MSTVSFLFSVAASITNLCEMPDIKAVFDGKVSIFDKLVVQLTKNYLELWNPWLM
jgi:hypothetical protein